MNMENISEYNVKYIIQIALQKHQSGEWDEAESLYKQVLQIQPECVGEPGKLYYVQAHNNLGNILWQQGKLEAALKSYHSALKIQPNYAPSHYNLGNIFLQQGKLDAAVDYYEQALKLKPDYAEAHNNLGNALKLQGKLDAAIESFRQTLRIKPDWIQVHKNLGNTLYEQGNLEAAVESYHHALRLNPEFAPAKFGIVIAQLPIIYSNLTEINLKRNNYQHHLQQLAEHYKLANPKELEKAADAVGSLQPFYLAYQCLNDRELQNIYGEMICQLMASRYPQWTQPIALPDLKENEKIRIGFVSSFFYNHSNWKIPIKGWVENFPRSEFELFGYYTDTKQDQETVRATKVFDKFTQGSLLLEQWCELIQKDKLHILIFPEFGMDPMTVKLGCLRLAPIQITSWGQPNTSGLPTIDYYLSSELMEPENAQEQYTEKLVKLPNLSIYYTPLAIQPQVINKEEIGIKNDEVMFWCCQSLFKYLPEHDDVFPRIAKDLGSCKFVFIQYDKSESVTALFRQRLSRAFEAFGLNYQDHCIFLPRLDSNMFAAATAIADVFLDSIGWSGCNSTLEAIAHNIPVVTLPGDLMRGRHTMAILKMMGIEETIATTKDEYVQMAVRLGQDAEYRQQISRQVAENKYKLYYDLKPIRSLEDFILDTVGKKSIVNQSQPDNVLESSVQSLINKAVEKDELGKLYEAESLYKQVLEIQPNHLLAQVSLADLLQAQNRLDEAIEAYQKVLNLHPNPLIAVVAYNNVGNALKQQGKLEEAVQAYQQALTIQPGAEVYNNLGNALKQQGKLEEAVQAYEQALTIQPDCADARFGILIGQLPPIYSSVDEIQRRRNHYQQHLHKLANYYAANPQERAKAAQAVGKLKPFYLGYQALDDRPLQQIYGSMICQLMLSRYPQGSQTIELPKLAANEKIRVGFVSGFFSKHSIWKIPYRGWVENLDRSEFELFGYHTLSQPDPETLRAAKAFDKFTQGPLLLEQWCEVIRQDKLHILIFAELMMDPMTVKLGCLRLAPIQIGSSLGHYVTSGLPTIDYFLSSDLMEPENGQDHYTEKLVRLPNLAFHYTPVEIQPKAITKKDIGIQDDEIMFWCCQSLFKYLPQHDDVFPRIAQELAAAKFVFLGNVSEPVTEVFRQRLNRAFEEFGLNYQNHCIFLPHSWDSQSFAGTTAIADIFLDSIGCSGGNTSIEAIGCNIPVVTLPGELMRGRVTMAFLKMMGISETIAATKEEYVKIAVRLGQDAQYRQHISQQIAQKKHQLYGDLKPVRALEDFLLKLVNKPRRFDAREVAETLQLAVQHQRENRLEDAEQLYRQVLEKQPDHPEALYGLGMLMQQMGQPETAQQLLVAASQVQPDSVKIWFSLGNLRQ
ncbi:O-linked N-acetylglucosamine transferase, SPINDLY family protein, partial [Microseira wollei]|uniref:O-linked N-acetylglucosamine transferase, SPINDLY family protein n=1 Tax=Microseira wollei TaxID=467598 RepID=UPI001CFF44B8